MPIFQQGSLNTTSLSVPDLYVQIVPPQPAINGVQSNILGIVGTASWGAVNSPVIASGPADATLQFGRMQARKYDLGTAVYAAALQGASDFRLVRVTDGTDVAASATITCANSALATALAAAINAGTNTLRGPSQLAVASSSTTHAHPDRQIHRHAGQQPAGHPRAGHAGQLEQALHRPAGTGPRGVRQRRRHLDLVPR